MQFYHIPPSLSAEIDELERLIKTYRQGELEAAKFRAYRVPFGIYEQRTADTYMTRIRCTGGGVTPAQLKKVALLAQQYGAEALHLTTRQELQIHDVRLEDTPHILRELSAVGLATRGGGGNTVRNIMVSWNAGIASDEPFDVTPYAISLTSMLIREPDSWTLPRKYKIAFANSAQDNSHCMFNDLGFMARHENGVPGFQVYVAGGLGSKPQVGHLLHPFVPADQVYRVAEAIKRVFDSHGNRKNKHAARLRFLWNKLGEKQFRELYDREFQLLGEKPLDPVSEIPTADAYSGHGGGEDSPDFGRWQKRFVVPQKQPGLCSILLPVPLGNLPASHAIQLADFLEPLGADVLRCTLEQNLSIRNVPEACLGDLYDLINGFFDLVSLPKFFSTCIACTGANTCKLGICLPRGALLATLKKLAAANLNLDALPDFRLSISGCPNSCGGHSKADLGFYGQVGRRGQRLYPSYGIVAGARIGGDEPRLALRIDSINARNLPDFVMDFLSLYLEKKEHYGDVAAYIDAEGAVDIQAICDKYREIPEFAEDRNYYFDWGAEEPFSLVGKGMGECSAGLFDTIEVDLQAIKAAQQELASVRDPARAGAILSRISLAAARMLLVTRGVEARSDADVYDHFITYFIEGRLIEKRFLPLLETLKEDNPLLLPARQAEINDLAAAVERLYTGMDDSLKFHPEYEPPSPASSAKPPVAGPSETQAHAFKDLRGVSCPMNFVKTKLELAKLTGGQLLRVFLDDGEPIENVPRSVAEEGHRIADQARIDDYWAVLIEKKH